ncbi:MAG: AAA-like domain-containing protein [Cyanobacteriota bacterium]|nr:AAA-like domain-containing protein [Cyanobacteriota bacterium]
MGRRREIEQVYSRLLSACESTSIVGESRIGKTSLLKALAHPKTQAVFGVDPEKYVFIYQDFQFLDANTTPTRFWQRVLRFCRRALKDQEDVVEEINLALKAESSDNYTLDDIFMLIDEADLRVILLLDEFENVTRNPQFDSDFFSGLRALAIHHNLALITSSREDLVELTHSEEIRSSPFFNIFATINLRSFSEAEATELIDKYLHDSEVRFLISELNVVFAVASYHPYLLQLACHHLYTTHQTQADDAARRQYVMDQIRDEAAPIFQNYWHDSTDSQKILLTVMTMRELEKENGENSVKELERFYPRASQVITELERRALVLKNPENDAYHLFSSELREWIAEEIVGSTDSLRAWRNWQKDETLIGVLPVNLQDMLAEVVRGLNPEYRDLFTNFLLDPSTAVASIDLVHNFAKRYEHYQESRSQRDPAVALANEEAPVGDTPKGLFDRVSQQLEAREKGKPANPGGVFAVSPKKSTPTSPAAKEKAPQDSSFPVISTGRTLRRLRKKAISSIALGGLVISGIVTKLELDEADKSFVDEELKWLFQACDHLLKICRQEIKRTVPIPLTIPPDAEKLPEADNKLLKHIDDSVMESWKGWMETRLEWINARLKELDTLLGQEASRGTAGKSDLDLQNKIKSKRVEILRIVEEVAQLLEQAYGIFVTSPGQLVEMIEDY